MELSTDNIALAIALAGYAPLALVVRALWSALERSQAREAATLERTIDFGRGYASQLDQQTQIMTAVYRTQKAVRDSVEKHFERVHATLARLSK